MKYLAYNRAIAEDNIPLMIIIRLKNDSAKKYFDTEKLRDTKSVLCITDDIYYIYAIQGAILFNSTIQTNNSNATLHKIHRIMKDWM